MRRPALLLALPCLALAACQVNVDNKSKQNVENAADSAGKTIGNVADAAGNLAAAGAAKVENAADSVGDKVKNTNINLNVGGGHDKDDQASNKSAHK